MRPEVVDVRDASYSDQFLSDWRQLLANTPGTSYFQTPDWILSWWKAFGDHEPTSIAVWRGPEGKFESVVVLSQRREGIPASASIDLPVYVNSGSGPGAADHCGWIVAEHHHSDATAWLADATAGRTLLVRSIRAMDNPPLPSSARVVERVACPRVEIPSPDDPVGHSKNIRTQLPRFKRKLERAGIEFETVPTGKVDRTLVDRLFFLHSLRWRDRRRRTAFVPSQDLLRLHHGLVEAPSDLGGPSAIVARHRGDIVGVLYGFCWQDTFAAYQAGSHPDWNKFSLGSVLIYTGIRAAGAQGARYFDFLRGSEPYKYRFGAEDVYDQTWLLPKGASGVAYRFCYGWLRRRRQVGRALRAAGLR
jgi:CelD/BcsL family acetyltransferase involved in cellulose biosynthesis